MATYNQDYIDMVNRMYKGRNLDFNDLYTAFNNSKDLASTKKQIEQIVNAQDEAILANNTFTEIRDTSLNVTNFRKNKMYTGKEAVARMIQHILITKKGTYPNNPNFGVGIEDYLFELATPTLKSTLEEEITNQLNLWLNGELHEKTNIETSQEIQFVKGGPTNNYITLAIFFTVREDNRTNGNTNEYKLSLFYTGDSSNRKIISKMDL